ncbi:SNF2 family helicase/ATPase [Ascosphaera apis ARSEF 7405]|uniref:SNF2 family helicase/ATPase n=1 Tax=Ascosphaera apis ARSEF 7405 TaxID=392613 RepID=A0A167VE47_9EURO|nr:SNF2 family helicase/ATPase [Ascosphaera apis ARSEF 7405]
MVRERQPPRMPGRVSHAPIIISDDDEGESIFEVSTSPMPRADQMRRLDTSRLPAKSRLQQEVDLESSSSDSDIDDSSIMSSKQDEPTQHKQDQKQQIPNEIPAKDGSNKDDNDESLEKFMESLKLAPKPANNASQKPEQQQQKAHIFEARTPGPKPGAPYPILNSAQPNRTQPGNQPKTISYSSVKTITNPLLIPKKKNPPSQEHYRPDPRTHDQPKFGQVSALQSPIAHHRPEQFRQKQSMYGPPQTPASKPQNSGGAVSIFRPTNKTITTPAAPRTIFSSKPTSKKPMSNIDMFTRLTNSRFEKPVTYKSDEFSSGDSDDSDIDGPIDSGDIYTYVDPEKANENLKALLEGALEDEEDKKPRTRSRKKKADKAVDDLAKRLETVKVEEGKDDSKEESPTLQNNIKPADVGVKDDEVEGEDEEEEEDDGTVEGLNIKLLPHQIDGVAWMRDKEIGKKKTRGVHPKGGILADDMGLGKTVQSIALILTNPRPPVDKEPVKEKEKGKGKKKKGLSPDVGKGTLIIAPLALIKQWEGEIESRVERSHRLLTCVYHGPQKNKYSDELHKYDVVITTYGTLSAEHAAWGKETIKKGIFKNTWYRIILDEAHTIKNRNAKATQAACALDSEYRWCLTGTPMQNNLEELQSLIHFLRIKPYENLTTFKEQIIKPLNNGRGTLAIRRLQVVLKAFMKRRTKDVLKEGGGLHGNKPEKKDAESGVEKKPSGGFKIVNREVIKIAAEFTPEEREFYDRLQHRTDKTLEKMAGSKLNYATRCRSAIDVLKTLSAFVIIN